MPDIYATIERPTLVLDQHQTKRNIQKMALKAAESGVRFRPHFKTHQSARIGEWFREEGVGAITVSSIDMASYFAANGWADITIAFPVNVRQLSVIDDLARRITLNLLVESSTAAEFLGRKLAHRVNIWLKVDTGYGRTGIKWNDWTSLNHVAWAIDAIDVFNLTGLLTHAGHTYGAGSTERIVEIYRGTVARLVEAREAVEGLDHKLALSVGDTPGCSLAPALSGVDEVRPGNFVFYDLAQHSFGACAESEISVAVACPVVAKHRSRSQLVVHCGAVHLSLDRIVGDGGQPIFGRVALPAADGWTPMFKESYVKSLSQEHGIIQAEASLFEQIGVGDLLMVIPVHSCLTADLMGSYLALDGERIAMAPRPFAGAESR